MEALISTKFSGFALFAHIFAGQNIEKRYTVINEVNIEQQPEQPKSIHEPSAHRKRKKYYSKMLELLMRKTESEKRMEIFGSDPFK
jgi:hypothetical protein